jgi:hypothetical protein
MAFADNTAFLDPGVANGQPQRMTIPTGPLSAARGFVNRRPLTVTLAILGAASTVAPGDPVFSGAVSMLTILAAFLLVRAAHRGWDEEPTITTGLAPVVAGALVALGWHRVEGTPVGAIRGWALIALTVVWLSRANPGGRWRALLVTLVLGTALAGATFGEVKLDVWYFHDQAAGRIADGESPYSGLTVPNGSPNAGPDDLVEGYPYPVVAMLPFVGAGLLGVDPRVASAVLWVTACGLVAFTSTRRRSSTWAALSFVMATGWVGLLWTAATESVSIALLVGATIAWASPVGGGMLLGAALASKQYLVVLGPLLLSPVITGNRRRLASVVVSAATLVAAGVVWDPSGFWNNAVLFHFSQPTRTDAISPIGALAALGWAPPLAGLVGVLLGLYLAWRLRTRLVGPSQWLLTAAAVLAVTFCLTPQAFPNYWFLVLCLVLLAQIAEDRPAAAES